MGESRPYAKGESSPWGTVPRPSCQDLPSPSPLDTRRATSLLPTAREIDANPPPNLREHPQSPGYAEPNALLDPTIQVFYKGIGRWCCPRAHVREALEAHPIFLIALLNAGGLWAGVRLTTIHGGITMTSSLFSVHQLEQLKKQGKELAKEKGLPHSLALDQLAKKQGFGNWSQLAKGAPKKPPTKRAMRRWFQANHVPAVDVSSDNGDRGEYTSQPLDILEVLKSNFPDAYPLHLDQVVTELKAMGPYVKSTKTPANGGERRRIFPMRSLAQVFLDTPGLSDEGFNWSQTVTMPSKSDERIFSIAVEWLSLFQKTKHKSTWKGSYGLKHVFEHMYYAWRPQDKSGSYISNGVFIAAAIEAGFSTHTNQPSPNCYFNLSKRSVVNWIKTFPREYWAQSEVVYIDSMGRAYT